MLDNSLTGQYAQDDEDDRADRVYFGRAPEGARREDGEEEEGGD